MLDAEVPAECSINYICNMLFINYSHLHKTARRQTTSCSNVHGKLRDKTWSWLRGERKEPKSWGQPMKTWPEQTRPDQTRRRCQRWAVTVKTSLAANAIPASKWRRQLSESKGVNKCGSEKGAWPVLGSWKFSIRFALPPFSEHSEASTAATCSWHLLIVI